MARNLLCESDFDPIGKRELLDQRDFGRLVGRAIRMKQFMFPCRRNCLMQQVNGEFLSGW